MRRGLCITIIAAGCGGLSQGGASGDTEVADASTGGAAVASSDGVAPTTSGAVADSTGEPPPGTTGDGPGTTGANATDASSGGVETGDEEPSGDSSTGAASGPTEGSFRVLSYNVAGLPDFISGSDPLVNTPLMSPLLNAYELVLAQEDFSYHAELSADTEHPFQSMPGGGGSLGDGLNRFSDTEFSDFERAGWTQCNGLFDSGSDCLTEKGFSVGLHELGPGAVVDVYNLHMDAGGSQADIEARQAQVQQLLETIDTRSAGRALIVAGDTNMDEEDEADFVTLLDGAGLTDTCRALDCGDEFRIDRVMIRVSDTVDLVPTAWIVDLTFVDGDGDDLSDHEAVVVDLDWAAL
ncbi:MAG: endonuclease [Myxococcota bacterium]